MFYDDIKDELSYLVNEKTIFSDNDMVVFIENEEDKIFWKFAFRKSDCLDKIAFIPHSKKGAQGKQEILKYTQFLLYYSGKVAICIDSDFDYILDNKNINENPFIFQTYTYSIESYSCCAKSLNHLSTENLGIENFDFEVFLTQYSEYIFEVFLLDILLKNESTNIDYKSVVTSESLAENGALLLQNLTLKISEKINDLKDAYDIEVIKINNLKNKIKSDNLLKENYIHLYINGHKTFEFIKEILKKLQSDNIKIQKERIKEDFKDQQINDKINELENKKLDISTLLKSKFDNCYYENYCPSFKKIIEDINSGMSPIL